MEVMTETVKTDLVNTIKQNIGHGAFVWMNEEKPFKAYTILHEKHVRMVGVGWIFDIRLDARVRK